MAATPRKKYDLKFKLSVVKFAEQNSGEAAARHFSVDPKRVREWRKNKSELQHLSEEDSKRARLRGRGRKKSSEELELQVCEWIHSMRARHLRVSRKMIRKKAKEIHATVSDSADVDVFAASAGWLDKFLQRNNLSVRRRTTVAQKDARHFTGKLVSFVTFTTRLIEKRKIQVKNIIAMDETAV
ncbi:Pogo transposable element with KRAB domain [Merluccius polli]|uniref:Pogo transposable element with KRAB domain n=1 Tax=Merluccius polli TaxID=89951 RepID=A0AA47PD47_MERPO|nr:Pogo transposable element with KRAB domain [Merluccius polli]